MRRTFDDCVLEESASALSRLEGGRKDKDGMTIILWAEVTQRENSDELLPTAV
jgi:hypothetical protein